jgi:hypothetical protein
MVGYKRLTDVCEGLFGLRLSQGAIGQARRATIAVSSHRQLAAPSPYFACTC